MEQHPIPRQITTFEFKLVGFMTLHQFLYLLVFVPLGFVVFRIIPIPVINVVFGILVATAGVLFAFLPVNDRPLDVFVRNLYKRLTSPTQYVYRKANDTPDFMDNAHVAAPKQQVQAHVDSQEKLDRYMASRDTVAPATPSQTAATVQQVFKETGASPVQTPVVPPVVAASPPSANQVPAEPSVPASAGQTTPGDSAGPSPLSNAQKPFFVGIVKNNKETPLPDILVYLKDQNESPVRLLKTNPHGVFATYSSLPQGEYLVEAKDPRGSYQFDTMKIRLADSNPTPLTMMSKGIL